MSREILYKITRIKFKGNSFIFFQGRLINLKGNSHINIRRDLFCKVVKATPALVLYELYFNTRKRKENKRREELRKEKKRKKDKRSKIEKKEINKRTEQKRKENKEDGKNESKKEIKERKNRMKDGRKKDRKKTCCT